jgi:hypothetical protein
MSINDIEQKAQAPRLAPTSKCSFEKKGVGFPFILEGLFDLEGQGAEAGLLQNIVKE